MGCSTKCWANNRYKLDVEYVQSNYGDFQSLFCRCARQHSEAIETEAKHKANGIFKAVNSGPNRTFSAII